MLNAGLKTMRVTVTDDDALTLFQEWHVLIEVEKKKLGLNATALEGGFGGPNHAVAAFAIVVWKNRLDLDIKVSAGGDKVENEDKDEE